MMTMQHKPHLMGPHQVIVPTQEAQLRHMVVTESPTPLPVDVANLGEAAFGRGRRGGYAEGVAGDGTHEGVLVGMRRPPL